MNKKIIFLPKKYNLVVGDRFELFYRGIIRAFNPYLYYILIECAKGFYYPRYYTFTPKDSDVGEYELVVKLFDNFGELIEEDKTILVVNKPTPPSRKVNILCIGDSLTSGGFWTKEGYRRFAQTGGEPEGLGFIDSIDLIGTNKAEVGGETIGHEGYGCWHWKSFISTSGPTRTSAVWIKVGSHNLTEADQHSVWENNQNNWILETIEKDQLKFKRGEGNNGWNPAVTGVMLPKENVVHEEPLEILSYEYETGNPFWREDIKDIDFNWYLKEHNFEKPDIVYILLSWNGLYIPYDTEFKLHSENAPILINKLHKDLPNAKIRIMGITLPSVTGGITSNYGCKGPYHDVLGDIFTCFNYNKWLEEMCEKDEYKDFMEFVEVKSQFDVEYNMPYAMNNVNSRYDEKEIIGNNGVHPMVRGYNQIGDVFFRSLVKELKEF